MQLFFDHHLQGKPGVVQQGSVIVK
jgi:hypothetical protein